MQNSKLLNVVVPCYNPEKGWENNLADKYFAFQKALAKRTTILTLVVDGRSPNTIDNNILYLKSLIPNINIVISEVNQGKGAALRLGVNTIKEGDIVFTDIDFPYDLQSMVRVTNELTEHDVVLGYRNQGYYKTVPPFRIFLSKILRWFLKNVLNLVTTDTQCGLKAFNHKGKEIFLKTKINRFLFDLEFVKYCSTTPGLKITSTNVSLRPNIVFSKVNFKVLFLETLNFIRLITVLKH